MSSDASNNLDTSASSVSDTGIEGEVETGAGEEQKGELW